ncbi:homeobox-leucine zipper protein GLABRA 2 [Arachis duranensis]|uniref:Homeobox-leucine zipper protein GLABRA 2 n=1 Tax=Arachis duranensis TaxID=130453 RepID=A0A9C6T0M0_ARADU|nr:homeobox-leucine zipper protein GLABRA 2 [Arachis duranensis]
MIEPFLLLKKHTHSSPHHPTTTTTTFSMAADMSNTNTNTNNNNNNHPSHAKDFFASPALSLSLAGIFRHAGVAAAEGEAATSNMEVEDGDEGSGGGGGAGHTVDISSENSGPTRSRSEDDYFEGEGEHEDEDIIGDDNNNNNKNKNKKKRKKYHRHTAEQIREMEALFKESPHPDEKQRQQLSKQLGLAPRQVKFWFQNRRTQIKAIQERHENSLLKTEIEKLKEKNKGLRETINKACCPNCGVATTSTRDGAIPTEEQQLRIENAKLKAEIEKLRGALGKYGGSGGGGSTSPSCSSGAAGGHEQENRSSLDFYTGIFGVDKSRIMDTVNKAMEELITMATMGEPLWLRSVETGREILNYDEYIKHFSSLQNSSSNNTNTTPSSSKRSIIEASRDTALVFVDLPRLLQTFLDANQWKEMFPCLVSKAATVDVICNGEGSNRNGAAQLHSSRHTYMLTNVTSVATLAGRKSILKLAQRMTWGFCHAVGASSFHTWTKVTSKTGEDIRISSRKNLNDPGEPLGLILCAVSSVWLPVSPNVLFDFLRDETRRTEWDIMSSGGSVQSIANLAKGQDRGNAVTIQTIKSKENSMWVVQDCCTNAYESMVVYAPVDITGIQSAMTGCDSSNLAVLPSGFSIVPDGMESRPMVITSRQEEKNTAEGGSLFTIAFQILTNASPTAKLTMESVESVNTLLSCTLRNIRTSLQCEDS